MGDNGHRVTVGNNNAAGEQALHVVTPLAVRQSVKALFEAMPKPGERDSARKKSMRLHAIDTISLAMDARDELGNPTSVALTAAVTVLKVTDPDMIARPEAPRVTINISGLPYSIDAPDPSAIRSASPHPEIEGAVQHDPVRQTVGEDDTCRAAFD